MILNTIVKTVKRKSHRGSQALTTDQITTDIVAAVNETIREVVRMIPKRFFFKQGTVALSAGTAGTAAVYSLPSDCQEPINMHFTVSNALYVLQKIDTDKQWIEGIWNPAGSTNLPQFYREIGPNATTGYKQIELYPIPNASITLNVEYYRTKGTDLSTSDLNSEVTIIPDTFQDVLEKGATYYFLKGFDDSAAGIAKMDFDNAKKDYENGDDQDRDNLPAFKFGRANYRLPGFRMS